SVRPISCLVSVILDGILSVAAFSPASSQAKPDFPAITVETLASVAEPLPTGLQFPLSLIFETKPPKTSSFSTQASPPPALHSPASPLHSPHAQGTPIRQLHG